MSTAQKIDRVIQKITWIGISIWAAMALREAAKRKGTEDYFAEKNNSTDGVGAIPVYTERLWQRYASCNDITDAYVDISDRDSKGRFYVACGDQSGGRGFYASVDLIKKIRRYCAWHCLPFDVYNT